MHSIQQRADLEPAPLVIIFGVLLEAIRIGRVPGMAAEQAQILDREFARIVHRFGFVCRIPFGPQLLAQMADRRGRLKSDLA